jgi:predicted transcriptional regulator of viral defense system
MNKPEADLYTLAEDQYGVFSRAQAVDKGLKDSQVERRIRDGRFERLHPGVYRVAGAPVTGRQRAMAATLWLGDDAHTSVLTAGALLRLDGFVEPDLQVSVPRTVRAREKSSDVIVHRVASLPLQDRVIVDGIRCTSATRTIVDCASVLDSGGTRGRLRIGAADGPHFASGARAAS